VTITNTNHNCQIEQFNVEGDNIKNQQTKHTLWTKIKSCSLAAIGVIGAIAGIICWYELHLRLNWWFWWI
jgi:hypothetical protein